MPRKGFTMIEVLLVLAVLGLLYYSFLGQNVGTLNRGASTAANALHTELDTVYGAWTSFGGHHVASLTANVANEGMFAYDLMTVLSSTPMTNAANPPHYGVTGVADGPSTLSAASNRTRMTLAAAISDPGAAGTQGVIYGGFYVLAKPTTIASAVWQVTTTPPAALP